MAQSTRSSSRMSVPQRYALKPQDGMLDPAAISESDGQLQQQQRSAWTHEMDLRPWMETW
jgi:hypothetical protein